MMLVPRKNLGMSGFDDFFSDPFFARSHREETLMRTDIKEKDGNYMLTMDLPGYDKKDIKAELNDGYLTISATKNENIHTVEYKLTLDSNPEFTSSILAAFARAIYRMKQEGRTGCLTVFDVPPAYLSTKSGDELRHEML